MSVRHVKLGLKFTTKTCFSYYFVKYKDRMVSFKFVNNCFALKENDHFETYRRALLKTHSVGSCHQCQISDKLKFYFSFVVLLDESLLLLDCHFVVSLGLTMHHSSLRPHQNENESLLELKITSVATRQVLISCS